MNFSIKAVLCDIDGTIIFNNRAVAGAADAIAMLKRAGVKLRFLSNITSRLPAAIALELRDLGVDVGADEIQTSATVCASMLKRQVGKTSWLLLPERSLAAFEGIDQNDESPDFVVVGDVGAGFTYEAMQKAFTLLDRGAALIALQRNMFWFDGQDKKIDAGAFIAGLEAASGKGALTMGKPSSDFFQAALDVLRCRREDTIVVGDDVTTDIRGAHNSGMRCVLVKTGKGRSSAGAWDDAGATWEIQSIAALPALIAKMETL